MHKRLENRFCTHCGEAFRPSDASVLRCSRACGFAARRERVRGFALPPDVASAAWLELGHGFFALVDADAWSVLSVHSWHRAAGGYAATNIAGRRVLLHRLLVPGTAEVDHRNRDRLDNRRANLRPATRAQNARNAGLRSANTSGFRGVARDGRGAGRHGWIAKIKCSGVTRYIGTYRTAEAAAHAYDVVARELFGEFAATNFPVEKTA